MVFFYYFKLFAFLTHTCIGSKPEKNFQAFLIFHSPRTVSNFQAYLLFVFISELKHQTPEESFHRKQRVSISGRIFVPVLHAHIIFFFLNLFTFFLSKFDKICRQRRKVSKFEHYSGSFTSTK